MGVLSGFGQCFVQVLLQVGVKVVFVSCCVECLKELCVEIEVVGGVVYVVLFDVIDVQSIKVVVVYVEMEVGMIDIFVNNLGVLMMQKFVDVMFVDFEFVFDMNMCGVFFVVQEVVKWMIMCVNGGGNGKLLCWIINIVLVVGLCVFLQIGLYVMSKVVVVQMMCVMVLEWGCYGINVNVICLGYIDIEINYYLWEIEQGQKLQLMLLCWCVGKLQDFDGLLLLFVVDELQFINGLIIFVDDGFGFV